MPTPPPLLALRDFCVSYAGPQGAVRAVQHVDLDLASGESLAVVGESGCGKSSLALGLLRLLPSHQATVEGGARFRDQDLLRLPLRKLQDIRGRRIAMIFQDPMTSLNPYLRIGLQVGEPVRRHLGASRKEALAHAARLLGAMGLPDPETQLDRFPHEFSGGMRQRAMIGTALACEPDLLVADEPTTALDVTIQAQILELLKTEMHKRDMVLLLITHDLGVVAGLCERVAIMYAGQIVEAGAAREIYRAPCHPYTRALLASVPRVDTPAAGRLASIPGQPPALAQAPHACAFAPRCPHVQEACWQDAPLLRTDSRGRVHRCRFELPLDETSRVHIGVPSARRAAGAAVLATEDLRVHFSITGGLLDRVRRVVRAVDGVSLTLHQGEVLGLVGESGCGKSTFVRAVLQLVPATAGRVRFGDCELTRLRGRALREVRQRMQIIFQDPYASLNPRMPAGRIIAEPLVNFGLCRGRAARQRASELMEIVGLRAAWADRYPHEFSGGQRQRIGIARALAVEPEVLLCDEPVSALDVSVQAEILNLLADLRERLDLSLIFISHDLAVVRHIADRVAVMLDGRIVEEGDAQRLFAAPQHAYTRTLLAAVPVPEVG